MKQEIKKILVTPKLAKELLGLNTHNRDLNKSRVRQYAEDMKKGLWKEDTFEIIKVSKTNRILDGQHRLEAIVASSISIPLQIAYDLDDEIFDVIDSGAPRNAADCFRIAGVKYHTHLPSIINLYTGLSDGYRYSSSRNGSTLTNQKLLALYYENEAFWNDTVSKTLSWYRLMNKAVSPSNIGALYALFFDKNISMSVEFWQKLATGLDVKSRPIEKLRLILLNDAASLTPMKTANRLAIIIKTWNLYRQNRQTNSIKYDPHAEEYPKPI